RLNHEGGIGKNNWTVEAYAPVYYPGRNRPTGVFEFYVDHAVAQGSVRKQAVPLTIALLLMLVGLYAALLPILRRITRALALSNDELRLQAKDLQENLRVRTAIEQRLRETIKELARSEDRLEHSQEETILRLSTAVASRDAETGSHIVRMGRFCELLTKKLGWDQDRCDLMRIASPLHDVGKIAIPDRVMLKPGALTSEERATMQEHAAIGSRILAGSESPLLDLAARIALTHHEKWDGSGYPNGLAGEEIPIEGRIAAIADVFDALTSDRVYRPAMSLDRAFAILAEGRGTHFDPTILDVFFASIDDVLAIGDKVETVPGRMSDGSPIRRRRNRVPDLA
ncbi:MAG: HD domain-containing protein, partial [Thermoleophilia bacterium]|nr:HD domain-containing protein [Thermoleophilia bacterium]